MITSLEKRGKGSFLGSINYAKRNKTFSQTRIFCIGSLYVDMKCWQEYQWIIIEWINLCHYDVISIV